MPDDEMAKLIERQGEVVHLIAERLWRPELARPVATARSRDFR